MVRGFVEIDHSQPGEYMTLFLLVTTNYYIKGYTLNYASETPIRIIKKIDHPIGERIEVLEMKDTQVLARSKAGGTGWYLKGAQNAYDSSREEYLTLKQVADLVGIK